MLGEKLQLGNWQNYERTAILIMLAESARFNHAGITPKQVDRQLTVSTTKYQPVEV